MFIRWGCTIQCNTNLPILTYIRIVPFLSFHPLNMRACVSRSELCVCVCVIRCAVDAVPDYIANEELSSSREVVASFGAIFLVSIINTGFPRASGSSKGEICSGCWTRAELLPLFVAYLAHLDSPFVRPFRATFRPSQCTQRTLTLSVAITDEYYANESIERTPLPLRRRRPNRI